MGNKTNSKCLCSYPDETKIDQNERLNTIIEENTTNNKVNNSDLNSIYFNIFSNRENQSDRPRFNLNLDNLRSNSTQAKNETERTNLSGLHISEMKDGVEVMSNVRTGKNFISLVKEVNFIYKLYSNYNLDGITEQTISLESTKEYFSRLRNFIYIPVVSMSGEIKNYFNLKDNNVKQYSIKMPFYDNIYSYIINYITSDENGVKLVIMENKLLAYFRVSKFLRFNEIKIVFCFGKNNLLLSFINIFRIAEINYIFENFDFKFSELFMNILKKGNLIVDEFKFSLYDDIQWITLSKLSRSNYSFINVLYDLSEAINGNPLSVGEDMKKLINSFGCVNNSCLIVKIKDGRLCKYYIKRYVDKIETIVCNSGLSRQTRQRYDIMGCSVDSEVIKTTCEYELI
jgi:hypothetical protein